MGKQKKIKFLAMWNWMNVNNLEEILIFQEEKNKEDVLVIINLSNL